MLHESAVLETRRVDRVRVTPRRRRLLWAMVALQVAVPLAATLYRVPSPLGFHMYGGYEPWSLTVRDDRGTVLDVDRMTWVEMPREDVAWAPLLAPLVCADVPEAHTVTVRQFGADEVTTCDR